MSVANAVLQADVVNLEESKWILTVMIGMTCFIRITMLTGDRDWDVMTSASLCECNEAGDCHERIQVAK